MLGDEEYAVDIIVSVFEIIRIPKIAKAPNSADHIEKVINLRGRIIPVINLRTVFLMPKKDTDEKSRVIVMNLQGTTMGILVDSVSKILRIPSDIIEPVPEMALESIKENDNDIVLNTILIFMRHRGQVKELSFILSHLF